MTLSMSSQCPAQDVAVSRRLTNVYQITSCWPMPAPLGIVSSHTGHLQLGVVPPFPTFSFLKMSVWSLANSDYWLTGESFTPGQVKAFSHSWQPGRAVWRANIWKGWVLISKMALQRNTYKWWKLNPEIPDGGSNDRLMIYWANHLTFLSLVSSPTKWVSF